jgi:hypothetical protein
MGDLGSEIFKKYGVSAIVFAVVVGLIIWLLAHWTAAPGKEVSILWGLVRYTKTSQVPTGETVKKNTDQVEPQEDKREIYQPKLTPIDLFVKHGMSNQNLKKVLGALRADRKLRELSAIESGKKVSDIPQGTYFFLSPYRIISCPEHNTVLPCVSKKTAMRFGAPYYFEIQHTNDGELHLIGYVNEVHATEISKLSGTTVKKVIISPSPWGQMTSLVSVPLNRIQMSYDRDVEVSQENQITVIDVTIQ